MNLEKTESSFMELEGTLMLWRPWIRFSFGSYLKGGSRAVGFAVILNHS